MFFRTDVGSHKERKKFLCQTLLVVTFWSPAYQLAAGLGITACKKSNSDAGDKKNLTPTLQTPVGAPEELVKAAKKRVS